MFRRVAYLAVSASLLLVLGGCGALNLFEFERRDAWRAQEEKACLASRAVRQSDLIQRVRAINGNGSCGLDRPLAVAALGNGYVSLGPTATLGCPMVAALEQWLNGSVQPAAMQRFGMQVVAIKQMSSYSCRPRNNRRGARLSEHGYGNALDVGAFQLADGRVVTVKGGWGGAPDESAFLHQVHAEACRYFKTVLGPGVAQHSDHLHLDLAHHNEAGTTHYCRPKNTMPPAPAYEPYQDLPVAGLPAGNGAAAYSGDDAQLNAILYGGNPFGVDPETTGATQAEDGDFDGEPPVDQ